MNFSLILVFVGLLLVANPFADAKSFLESDDSPKESETDLSDMLAMLLEHPEAVDMSAEVRNQHAKDSHARNQASLAPMFKSLPQNEHGNLGLPAARYALHRLFEHRHRWFVRGLHPKTKGTKDTSGTRHVVDKAMHLLTVFDKKGLSLPALAALAGTLDSLILKETASHVRKMYAALGHDHVQDAISGKTLRRIAESYMVIYISGASFRNCTKEDIMDDSKFMAEHTRDWTETQDWVKATALEAAKAEDSCEADDVSDCSFNFDEATRVVKTVVEKYGYFNDRECHKLKSKLVEVEQEKKRSGRVKLADFYNAGLSGAWEFNEKIDYLRSLGALDESTKDDPKVIVPNYVSSWVNCLSSSKYYSVCCRNECEDYMKVLEKHVAGPMADPDKIIMIVETQAVFTIDAPPNLSQLRHRLISIAERHHGRVPLHGRLFAQWMHHAFPSNCPYPHESGKTNPQTPDEWITETGHTNIKASEVEVQQIVNQAKEPPKSDPEVNFKSAYPGELPWTEVEELLVVRPHNVPNETGRSFVGKAILVVEALTFVALVCVMIWVAFNQRRLRLSHNKGHKF